MILEKRKGNRALFFFLSLSLERPTTPTPVQSDVERDFNLYCGDSTLKEIFCKSLSADFQGAKCDPFLADESRMMQMHIIKKSSSDLCWAHTQKRRRDDGMRGA